MAPPNTGCNIQRIVLVVVSTVLLLSDIGDIIAALSPISSYLVFITIKLS